MMRSALKHLQAILALPFMVIIVIPTGLVALDKTFNPLWGQSFPVKFLFGAAGFSLISGGLLLIISTIRLFMTVGHGTLAPWDPTQSLVVCGSYRYVRNPMISGVIGVLLGEAALLGSRSLFIWSLAVVVVNLIYLPLIEEPGLCQRFGEDYQAYMRHVPRWIPSLHPWTGKH
jgi:protein-S-isoprenylcysteine O-methyltransferase Ste14